MSTRKTGFNQKMRRLWRRFQYIHPTRRPIILVTVCIWISSITLWSIRHVNNQDLSTSAFLTDDNSFVVFEPKSPFDTVVHKSIVKWHREGSVQPKLFPGAGSKWRSYPQSELHAWNEVPLHSVRIAVDNNQTYLGEMGAPVQVPEHLKNLAKEKHSLHQLNIVASDLVSLNRRLPDIRHERCRDVTYPRKLPRVSVIVVFHNEAWSTLLRTVHSVINRSPPSLLEEVLLVDDASDHLELGQKLDKYLLSLPVSARAIRIEERGGLIKARLAGAEQAMGSVLIFLDAHTEASPGWLPPILAEIATDRTRVIVPVIDDIMDDTFAYEPVETEYSRGGLDWKLLHSWIDPQPFVNGRNPEDAFPTPTMIGCAFAIDREFFFASGAYDSKMMIWGGENVEMSVRVWRCGGSLLATPCSRVGHVYRKNTPHTVPGGLRAKADILNVNTARFAEVWLDEFKHFYYFMNPAAKNLPLGDLNERMALKEELRCHDFAWFLRYVYPDSTFPYQIKYVGSLSHKGSGLCLDAVGSKGESLAMKTCHGLGGFQVFLFTNENELRSSTNCLGIDSSQLLRVTGCDFSSSQKWIFKPVDSDWGQIISQDKEKCLTFTSEKRSSQKSMLSFLSDVVKDAVREMESPTLTHCLDGNPTQLWSMSTGINWKQK